MTPAAPASSPATEIHALRPAVTRDDALRTFGGGLMGTARSLALGPLRSIADLYVPLDVFRVRVTRGARRETELLGIDRVTGALDLYRFDDEPGGDAVVTVTTRNAIGRALPDAIVRDRLQTRVARMLFQRRGFFGVHAGAIAIEARVAELYVPYWVGFFGRGEEARIAVIDAVRRRDEGPKARRLVYRWLMESR